MSPHVLILASLFDFAIDGVVRHLTRSGVNFLRLNREQFQDYRITFDPIARRLHVRGLGLQSEVDSDLGSVWYRAPVFPRSPQGGPPNVAEQLSRSQWSAFLRAMMVFDSARWMNHPTDTYRAESKPVQLQAAVRCGFRIPETVITNDVASIRGRFSDLVAVKSIDTVYLRDGDDVLFAYTSLVRTDCLHDGNVHQAPVIAQSVLASKVDLRVTVVDDALWAYRITSEDAGIEGDWRRKKRADLQFTETQLANDTAQRCVELCRLLRLPFAAIDLADTADGTFFIEVNPTGEWAWLPGAEDAAGPAIASWLARSSALE